MYEESPFSRSHVLDRRGATATLIRECLSTLSGTAGRTQEPLVLREFRASDRFTVKSLVHRTIAVCYPAYYALEAVRFFTNSHDEQAIVRDAREGCTLVLEKTGRILGTGTLVGEEIKRVFIEPGLQQHGLGRFIMRQLEDKAASRGVGVVRLDASLPAKQFYDRLGYTTVERTSLEVENGRRLDHFKMRKSLMGLDGQPW